MQELTIFIPCYNDNKHLARLLHSLNAQLLQNFKVVVLDDAGEQAAADVVEQFPELCIEVIRNKINLGVAKNRYNAITYLAANRTTYFMFCDSDDILKPDATYTLCNGFENEKVDIVVTNIDSFHNGYSQIDANGAWVWMHGKMYRSDFICDNSINFPTGIKTNEDMGFNIVARSWARQINYLDKNIYMWCENENSLTAKASGLVDQCRSIDYIDSFYYSLKHVKHIDDTVIHGILFCYSAYQVASIHNLLKPKQNKELKELLHTPMILKRIVNINKIDPEMQRVPQWEINGDDLVFFQETFGQWLARFITPNEIKEAIKLYAEVDKK